MNDHSHRNCGNCECKWQNFENLTDTQMELLNKNRFQAKFKHGEIIFKQGSRTSDAVFITKGFGKIYIEGDSGKNIILEIARPGRMIAGPGTYVDKMHHYSLSALGEVEACFINIDLMTQMIHENSQFAEGFLKDLSQKSLGTFEKLINYSQKKMHGRLADGILKLSNKIYMADKFKCALSRQELGEFTGMTKESVVRLLKEFHDDGILKVDNSSIEIVDKAKLEKIMITG